MNILIVHNRYRLAGGEDQVSDAEAELLESHGHTVFRLIKHNDQVARLSAPALALSTVWNGNTYREIRDLVRGEKIAVVHFHNILPLVSPAGYFAARDGGAAVVQTLHNYRLLCVAATLYRGGSVCETCVGHAVPWQGVLRRCYRNSISASAGVAVMLSLHRFAQTWKRQVNRYVALTAFARDKFVEGGIPESLISVKPNFIRSSMPDWGDAADRSGFLYAGRLSEEKGLAVLADAIGQAPVQLTIIGGGPIPSLTVRPNIDIWGVRGREEIFTKMQSSVALVFPSLWYEGFPMVIAEAFANSLPVIASRIGGIPEIVEDGKTGLLFNPGDPADMAAKLAWADSHRGAMREMGRNALAVYRDRYSPEPNYRALMSIYDRALA